MKITKQYINKLIRENTGLDRIVEISSVYHSWRGGYEFDVLGRQGGDALEYRFHLKEDGSLNYVTER